MTHKIKNILLVCTGNTCRSPMAEGFLRHLLEKKHGYTVRSAGLAGGYGAPASHHAIEAMNDEGIDISNHKSSMLTGDMLEEADIVLVMTEGHKRAIADWFTGMADKVHLLREYDTVTNDNHYPNIPEPIGASLNEYKHCLEIIKKSLIGFMEKL